MTPSSSFSLTTIDILITSTKMLLLELDRDSERDKINNIGDKTIYRYIYPYIFLFRLFLTSLSSHLLSGSRRSILVELGPGRSYISHLIDDLEVTFRLL